MKNVVAAMNSSIQFNKKNFWIDPVSANQYFVGVQYEEDAIASIESLLDVPITGASQSKAIPLRNLARARRNEVPAEVTHANLQPTIDLTMGVQGRDLGHVAVDVAKIVAEFGVKLPGGGWEPFDPDGRPKLCRADGSCLAASILACRRRSATWGWGCCWRRCSFTF